MKKRQEHKHHATHTEKKTEQKEENKTKRQTFNLFKIFSRFIKQKLHKSHEPETTSNQPEPLPKGPPPKIELSQELKQLIDKQDDSVNKLYQLDIMLRKYYSKEYKIGKKLAYNEMIAQLEEKQQTSAADLIKKIIEYAYSGKALENAQMSELLSIFQELMIADTERKLAEKESHQKDKIKSKEREQEVLADKLIPVAPQLPPSAKPFLQMPVIELQKYSSKLRELVDTIKKVSPTKIFARAQLPKTTNKNMPQKENILSKESQSILPSMHLPELRLPNFSDIHLPKHKKDETIVPEKEKPASKHKTRLPDIKNIFHLKKSWLKPRGSFKFFRARGLKILDGPSETKFLRLRKSVRFLLAKALNVRKASRHVKKFSFSTIHAPHLELPKITLPHINLNEPHGPRHKLSPFRVIGDKISHIHMPHPHLPHISIPHPKLKASRIRKILHLPKFHPSLYLERIKEHIPEIHPSEYINTIMEHIPRVHPSEYYVSIKENARMTWEKIHPPKATEEELALQAELANEQIQEAQEPSENPEPVEKTLKTDTGKKILTTRPIFINPEKYWIEYKPRQHAQKVKHSFAYEIDDVRHIKNILRKHHKPGMI